MKQKNLFLVTLCIAVLARAMTWHEISLPYSIVYYLYCAYWGILMLRDNNFKIYIQKDPITKALLMLLLYFIVFGFSNIINLDFIDTIKEMFRSVMMVFFVFISCYWIKRYKAIQDSINYLYITFCVLMLGSLLIHIGEINLINTISTFWNNVERYRVKFGFSANNIASEYAVAVVLLSLMAFSDGHNKLRIRLIKLVINILMIIIVIANNSRGLLLALIVIFGVNMLLSAFRKYSVAKVLRILISIAVVTLLGIITYCKVNNIQLMDLLLDANRYHFMDNIEILKKSNRWLMGLGNISGEYFRNKNYLYGLQTNYIEIYYIRVFVTSGIIGSIWILKIIFVFLKEITSKSLRSTNKFRRWVFLVYVYMLFYSLYSGYLFGYTHATSPMFLVIIISYLQLSRDEDKKEKQFNGERNERYA